MVCPECKAITDAGTRCKRRTCVRYPYCWQHLKLREGLDPLKIGPNKEFTLSSFIKKNCLWNCNKISSFKISLFSIFKIFRFLNFTIIIQLSSVISPWFALYYLEYL